MDIGGVVLQGAGGMDQARLAKLTDGANQFEGMMLQQMLKDFKFGTAPGDVEQDSQAEGSPLQGYATESLAKAIAQGGGFGIAKQIVKQVSGEERRRTKSAE